MTYNFHTHTYHCHHASGTPEEYVLRAIANGITEMGFSDHFPWTLENGFHNSARVPVTEVPTYLSEIRTLQEKYKEKIQIHIGFEMEYYSEHFDKMKAKAIEYGAEYLLLGEHYAYPEDRTDAFPHASKATTDASYLIFHTDRTIEGMKTGCFTYVAHPDVLHFVGDKELHYREMHRICLASLELSIPLEINFLGIRDGRYYPCDNFLKAAAETGAPITFGFDAHTVESAYDGASLLVAKKMVKDYDLNYIGKPVFRPII